MTAAAAAGVAAKHPFEESAAVPLRRRTGLPAAGAAVMGILGLHQPLELAAVEINAGTPRALVHGDPIALVAAHRTLTFRAYQVSHRPHPSYAGSRRAEAITPSAPPRLEATKTPGLDRIRTSMILRPAVSRRDTAAAVLSEIAALAPQRALHSNSRRMIPTAAWATQWYYADPAGHAENERHW